MKKTILLASLALGMSALAQVPTNAPAGGLKGWWRLDANGNDETSTSTCSNYHSAGTTDRYNNANSASHFDGSSDFIQIADNAALSHYTNLSISVWAKTNGISGTHCLVAKWWQALNPGGNSDTYEVAITGGGLNFATSLNNTTGLSSVPGLLSSDVASWHHFVFVLNIQPGVKSIFFAF
jgi:hypothetical protein